MEKGMEQDKKDNRVHFHFTDLHKEGVSYDAGFYPWTMGGEKNWLDLTQMPGSFPHFYREEAWELFRNNAMFNDILDAESSYHILDVIHQRGSIPDFENYDVWTDQRFLAELSKHPDWLAMPETGALQRLIFTMRTANEANSDRSTETIKNLRDYFIPKRPGGAKSLPVNLSGILYLLTDLAKHLRSLCMYCPRTDHDTGQYDYVSILEWAQEDEHRIYEAILNTPPKNISHEDKLRLLMTKPTELAETILAADLRMSPSSLHSALYK